MSYLAQGVKGLAVPLALTLLVTGCNSSDKKKDTPPPVAKKETTEIQWTSYGVPHIKAENYLNLGKGLGLRHGQGQILQQHGRDRHSQG